MVLQAKGTEWVFLRPVFEVCVKEMGFKGGEGARSVVASDSRGEAAEDHAKIDFGSGEGAAEMGIWQAW